MSEQSIDDPEPCPDRSDFITLNQAQSEAYHQLQIEDRYDLQAHTVQAMMEAAAWLHSAENDQDMADRTVSLINTVPLMFEPINQRMVLGQWSDDETELTLEIEQADWPDRLVLLIGVAALEEYLSKKANGGL